MIDLVNGFEAHMRQGIIESMLTDVLSVLPLWINFSETEIKIQNLSFKLMYVKMSSGNYRPFCSGFNMLSMRNQKPESRAGDRSFGPG